MPRVKLLQTKDDLAPEHAELFDELAALRGRVSGPSSVMLYSTGLSRPWNQISEYLHSNSVVEAEHAELAVLVTARYWDCGYIWNAHLGNARKAGVSEQTIDAVRSGGSLDGLRGEEAEIVQFARELLQDNRVESEVYDPLRRHSNRWILELTLWIGRYSALAGILNAFEVSAAEGAEILPKIATPAHRTPVSWPLAQPRIEGVTSRQQMPEDERDVFDLVAEGRGYVRGPFALLMHCPPLCVSIFAVSNYLRFESELTPRLRELAVIATAREKDCPYVWAAHAPAARNEGIDAGVVATIRDRGGLDGLPPQEQDIVAYVRQLMSTHRVDQALFDRLRDDHGVTWLVELTALIGHYVLTCALLSAFEVSPVADAEKLPF